MIRSSFAGFLSLSFCVATSFAQSSPCSLSDHAEYSKNKRVHHGILLQHRARRPSSLSSCVPALMPLFITSWRPRCSRLHKDINAYFASLPARAPASKFGASALRRRPRDACRCRVRRSQSPKARSLQRNHRSASPILVALLKLKRKSSWPKASRSTGPMAASILPKPALRKCSWSSLPSRRRRHPLHPKNPPRCHRANHSHRRS